MNSIPLEDPDRGHSLLSWLISTAFPSVGPWMTLFRVSMPCLSRECTFSFHHCSLDYLHAFHLYIFILFYCLLLWFLSNHPTILPSPMLASVFSVTGLARSKWVCWKRKECNSKYRWAGIGRWVPGNSSSKWDAESCYRAWCKPQTREEALRSLQGWQRKKQYSLWVLGVKGLARVVLLLESLYCSMSETGE